MLPQHPKAHEFSKHNRMGKDERTGKGKIVDGMDENNIDGTGNGKII